MKKLGYVIAVTKQTQAREGLSYTLEARRVSPETVLVTMEIPREGKLKDSFQLASELAERCSVDLLIPKGSGEYFSYAVQLKEYITDAVSR